MYSKRSKFKFDSGLLGVRILVILFGASGHLRNVFGAVQYSAKENLGVQLLRPLVADALYRDHMNEDAYLVQWLRFANHDTSKASEMIRKAHKWRQDKNIDSIAAEDWTKFERELPYRTDGVDLEGRPIMTLPFGTWNLRKVVLAGQTEQYNRYLDRMMEIMSTKAREGFNKTVATATGHRDVPDWMQIHDLAGYNLRTHGCLACTPATLTYASDTDAYFSHTIKANYVINAPRIFEAIYQLIRNLLSQRSRDLIKLYSVDKQEWVNALLAVVAPDQLPPIYGGTKRI